MKNRTIIIIGICVILAVVAYRLLSAKDKDNYDGFNLGKRSDEDRPKKRGLMRRLRKKRKVSSDSIV